MNHRIESILLLLRSRHDFDFVGVRDSLSSLKPRRGETASVRVECPDCRGRQRRRVRGFDTPCIRCPDPETGQPRGWIEVDDYTGRQDGQLGAPLRMKMVCCDACVPLGWPHMDRGSGMILGDPCWACGGSGRRPVPYSVLSLNGNGNGKREERTGDPRLDAGIVRSQAGSYDELTVAMGKLNAWDFYAYRAVVALENGVALVEWTAGRQAELPDGSGAVPGYSDQSVRSMSAAWRGLLFIEPLMPEPIRVPSSVRFNESERWRQLGRVKGRQVGQENLRRRNERIRQLRYVEQLSVHQIRQEFPELSRSLVYAILEEEAAA